MKTIRKLIFLFISVLTCSFVCGACTSPVSNKEESKPVSVAESSIQAPESIVSEPEESLESIPVVVMEGECGEKARFTLDSDGLLTITGEGKMDDYFDEEAEYDNLSTRLRPWSKDSVIKVVVAEGITAVGSDSFNSCKNLTAVQLPKSLTSIGKRAFCSCSSLESINIPDGVAEIPDYAFESCPLLAEIKFGKAVAKLGEYSFHSSGIKTITIPESIKDIGAHCFESCRSLEEVITPETVIAFGKSAFNNCRKLSKISIASGTEEIAEYMFEDCPSLNELVLPDTIKSIGNYAFSGCTGIKELTIPASVEEVGFCIFEKWTAEQNVIFVGKSSAPSQWSTLWNERCEASISWNG